MRKLVAAGKLGPRWGMGYASVKVAPTRIGHCGGDSSDQYRVFKLRTADKSINDRMSGSAGALYFMPTAYRSDEEYIVSRDNATDSVFLKVGSETIERHI